MIYPDYLQSEILKFCQVSDIPVVGGNIPKDRQGEVWAFVKYRMKKDRNTTRKKEGEDALKISPIIMKILGAVEQEASPIEVYLNTAIEKTVLKQYVKQQFQIGSKTVDFAFPIAKLVVECDGKDYHYATIEQVEKDQERDKYLAKRGWRILHIEGKAIRTNINLCIEQIKKSLLIVMPMEMLNE
jgi:very-short-patch-repair endonuclease